MFPRALRLVRVGGVDVRVDPSWLILAVLIAWSLLAAFEADARPTALTVTMAVTATVLLFVSVLVHELAHALEGSHRGLEVHAVTLFVFGGATEMHAQSRRPRDEFVVAAVGPYASLVCAAVFGLVAAGASYLPGAAFDPVADVAGLLGWTNVGLALLNLVPGAPLDGGRVLRAGIWAATGDRSRAVRWSSWAGQGVGLLLIVVAVRRVIARPEAIVLGALLGAVGWFMWRAARDERRRGALDALLVGHTASWLAPLSSVPIPVGAALSDVVDSLVEHPVADVFPAADGTGEVRGVLNVADVTAVADEERSTTTVGDVMRAVADLPRLPADAPLSQAVQVLTGAPALIIEPADGRVAVIGERQLEAALERLEALSRRSHPASGRMRAPAGGPR